MSLNLAVLALSLVAATQNAQATPPPAGTAKLSGLVTRSDTNQPLANVTVRLIRWDGGLGQQIPTTRTQSDGRFIFEGLREGEYTLTFSAEAFVTLEFGQRSPLDGIRRIQLQEAEHFAKADIALPPTTGIEGRLLDEFGDPAPGITVQVARVQYAAGKRRLMPITGAAASRPTDDLGQFRVFNLPPGDYYLMALAGPFAGPDDPSGFAVTYFPGTRVPTEAKAVHLEVGQGASGIVFPLIPAPMSTVSGVLTDAAGKPIPGEAMFLQTSGDDVRSLIMGRIPAGPDGAFTFRNVAPGTYVIQAYGRPVGGGNLGRAPFGSLPLTVSGGRDLTNLAVKVTGATARGKIILDGDAPSPAPNRVLVSPSPINFASAPVGGGPPNSVTHDDWTFEVSNMSGIRTMRVIVGARQWFLKKVMLGGKDITDEPIDFRNGDVDGLEVTLTSRGPTLAGTVTDSDKPTTDCSVIVFADDPGKWAFPSRYFAQDRPVQQGTFRIQGLPPGNYFAVALPTVQGTDWQDPEFLQQHLGVATRVTLAEAETKTISLKLIRR
jgi:5-hydroxyisourate hydrolase-like protein (transthyretin family)